MNKTKAVMTRVLATTMVASLVLGGSDAYARSSQRAAWNNAAGSKDEGTTLSDACYVEDGSVTAEHTVYSNVYADSEEWSAWKTTWENVKNNYELASLTPGEDATKLNFGWYSKTVETPKVRLFDSNGTLIKEFEGTQDLDKVESFTSDGTTITLYPNKVTVDNLEENTSYKYQYSLNGGWSEIYDYSTESTDSFKILYVGDPQIGASTGQAVDGQVFTKEYYAMNDAYNWYHTLANAVELNDDLSFILSAGDQINQTSASKDADKLEQQIEYAGFLYPEELRSLPIATTIGNHDSQSVNYSNHFNNPNTAETEETTNGATTAGTDYYFRYGNTLFVSIDTNNYNCATHENVIKEAVEANEDATWKILMFHQDIYGSGYDHSDSDGMILRTQLTPIIDKYGFDAVLQGHDHTYSRTYQLSANGVQDAFTSSSTSQNYYDANAKCYNILTGISELNKVIDPEGTVYFEANSSTGSKYYQLIGTQQNYIAARCQSWRPTYSVIEITENTFTVKTYDAATNEELVADGGIDTTYAIVKSLDKSALEEKIAEAEQALEDAENAGTYTSESIETLKSTIEKAEEILNDAEAGSVDITSAVTSLTDAIDGLTFEDTDDEDDNTNPSPSEDNVQGDDDNTTEDTGNTDNNHTDNTLDEQPKTGDNFTEMVICFIIAGLSMTGLVVIGISDRKKN
ncbi:MAG: metallophosphoesterase [Lachnospiraceae bacterium]